MSFRIIVFLLAGMALLTGLVFWYMSRPTPQVATGGSTVVVFGDSLAAGVGSTSGGDIASLLEAELGQPVVNLGVSGDTTADALLRLDEVLAADPAVVVVMLGGNDALQQVPIEQTFANVVIIIERLYAVGTAVVLVGEPGGLFDRQFEREYKRVAETYRTFYVSNILEGLIGRPEYMSDLVHPNDAGYRQAVLRILPEVEKALGGW